MFYKILIILLSLIFFIIVIIYKRKLFLYITLYRRLIFIHSEILRLLLLKELGSNEGESYNYLLTKIKEVEFPENEYCTSEIKVLNEIIENYLTIKIFNIKKEK